MDEFSELELDLLGELFNIGVGSATSSLSQIVHQEVKMSVPSVEFLTVEQLRAVLAAESASICSVSQEMKGPFEARSMMLFPEDSMGEIVQKMLGDDLPADMVLDMQQEAMSEIGNIVLNACIGSFAQSIGSEFTVEIPVFKLIKPTELLNADADVIDNILFIGINMTLQDSQISGSLAFVLSALSLEQLQAILKTMIGNL